MSEAKKGLRNFNFRSLRIAAASVAFMGGGLEISNAQAETTLMSGGAPIMQSSSSPSGGASLPKTPIRPAQNTANYKNKLEEVHQVLDETAKEMYLGSFTCKHYQRQIYQEGAVNVLTVCKDLPDVSGSENGIVEMDAVTKNVAGEPYKNTDEVEVSEGKYMGNGEYVAHSTDILTLNNHGATAVTQTGHFNLHSYTTNTASLIPRKDGSRTEADLTSKDIQSLGRQMTYMIEHQTMTYDLPLAFTVLKGSAQFPI